MSAPPVSTGIGWKRRHMRHDTLGKLDTMEGEARRRRIRRMVLAGGIVALTTLAASLFLQRAPLSQELIAGTVRVAHVGNDNGSGQREMKIEAVLDDGRMVFAFGRPLNPPRSGERILLRQREHWFGFTSYYWEGLRP